MNAKRHEHVPPVRTSINNSPKRSTAYAGTSKTPARSGGLSYFSSHPDLTLSPKRLYLHTVLPKDPAQTPIIAIIKNIVTAFFHVCHPHYTVDSERNLFTIKF